MSPLAPPYESPVLRSQPFTAFYYSACYYRSVIDMYSPLVSNRGVNFHVCRPLDRKMDKARVLTFQRDVLTGTTGWKFMFHHQSRNYHTMLTVVYRRTAIYIHVESPYINVCKLKGSRAN
jgi:hypothetical protein